MYAYVRNNPLLTADLDGHGTWYSPSGDVIGSDGNSDGAVYVAKKENISYANGHIDSHDSTSMYSFSGRAGNEMWKAIERTRMTTNNAFRPDVSGNMHEEGFIEESSGHIIWAYPGTASTPFEDQLEVTLTITADTTLAVHTHAGETGSDPNAQTLGGKIFNQEPSPGDLSNAKNKKIIWVVIGSGDESVRIHDEKKTKVKLELKDFPRCEENGDNCHY